MCAYVCVCARARTLTISPRYESLIFISKNFFNKKVAGSCAPSTSCIAGSRTGRCIFYIRGRRGNAHTSYSGPRRIKSFAWRSRYFITFLYFEKCAAGRPANQSNPDERARCTLSFLYVHARNMHLSSRAHVSALCLHIFVYVRLSRVEC